MDYIDGFSLLLSYAPTITSRELGFLRILFTFELKVKCHSLTSLTTVVAYYYYLTGGVKEPESSTEKTYVLIPFLARVTVYPAVGTTEEQEK
jgi:hypothetical protein